MKRVTLIDKAFFLKSSPLFASLDLDLLLSIADKMAVLNCDKNESVFVEQEEANRMYFIIKGQIQILSKKAGKICILGPSDFFGEEALFNDRKRGYEAISITDAQLLILSRTNLNSIISECPSVAVGFLRAYTSAIDFRPFFSFENQGEP